MSLFVHPYPHVDGHPSLAEVEITSACNARCVFCPRHLFTKPTTMTRETFDQLLRRLKEARMSHVKLVGIGEPTLHPDLLRFLAQLRGARIAPLLNTNGSLLGRWDLDRLLELCEEVIVSIHSLDKATHKQIFDADLYDKVVANLDALLLANERHRRTITLYVVLTTMNRGALGAFARYGDKIRLRVSGCTNRALEGFAEDLIDFDASEVENHYGTITDGSPMCGYADAAMMIDSLGRYLVCTNDVERETGLGNIFERSIPEAFQAVCDGLAAGRFMQLCSRCENYEPYRHQVEARQRTGQRGLNPINRLTLSGRAGARRRPAPGRW